MRVQLQAVGQTQNAVQLRPTIITGVTNATMQQAFVPQQAIAAQQAWNFAQPTQVYGINAFNQAQQVAIVPNQLPLTQAFVQSNIIPQTNQMQSLWAQQGNVSIQQQVPVNWASVQQAYVQPTIAQSLLPQQTFVQQPTIIQPSVDLSETSSEVVVACELPYVDQRSLNLSLNEDSVSIQAFSANGIYQRVVSLPTNIQPETCEATFANGVLEIKMPKTSKGRRKVNINTIQ